LAPSAKGDIYLSKYECYSASFAKHSAINVGSLITKFSPRVNDFIISRILDRCKLSQSPSEPKIMMSLFSTLWAFVSPFSGLSPFVPT